MAVADGVFADTTLNGAPFAGVGKRGGWSFTTRASAPTSAVVSVDDDAGADFRTVQGALSYAMKTFAKAVPVTINVKNGRYDELPFLRNRDNVSIVANTAPPTWPGRRSTWRAAWAASS